MSRAGDSEPTNSAPAAGKRSALYQAARAAWPDLELTEACYLPYLTERAGERVAELSAERAAELYLCCACAAGDERAIAALQRRYGGRLRAVLASMGLSPAGAEEILQQVCARLFVGEGDSPPKIADFDGRGALGAWLHVVAVRTALNRIRHDGRLVPTDDDELLKLPAGGDAELEHVKREHRVAFKAAFLQAMKSLSAREQNLIRQHFLDGLTLEEIGSLYRVHRVTVARWIASVRGRLRSRTRAQLAKLVGMGSSECDSLLRIMHSQFETTVRQCLQLRQAELGEDPEEQG